MAGIFGQGHMVSPTAHGRRRRQHDETQSHPHERMNAFFGKRGYLWVTLAFFVISLAGHWVFAWFAYAQEQQDLGQPVAASGYFIETGRDTLENWQSEFLQLCWQVAGLAVLWYVGSPQSRESDERKEEILEHILKKVDPENGERVLRQIEHRFPKS